MNMQRLTKLAVPTRAIQHTTRVTAHATCRGSSWGSCSFARPPNDTDFGGFTPGLASNRKTNTPLFRRTGILPVASCLMYDSVEPNATLFPSSTYDSDKPNTALFPSSMYDSVQPNTALFPSSTTAQTRRQWPFHIHRDNHVNSTSFIPASSGAANSTFPNHSNRLHSRSLHGEAFASTRLLL